MIIKIPIKKLLPYEAIKEDHLNELFEKIKSDGFLLRPIAVSKLDNFGRPVFILFTMASPNRIFKKIRLSIYNGKCCRFLGR